jgi:hypothetical protein
MQINCCLKAKYTELRIASYFKVWTTQAEPYQPGLEYMYNRYLIVRDMSRHSYNNHKIVLAGPIIPVLTIKIRGDMLVI